MDDKNIPVETIVYFSKWKTSIVLLIAVVLFVTGICLATEKKQYFSCIFFDVIAIALAIFSYSRFSNRKPQITINNLGIKTAVTDFYNWEEVGNECVTRERKNKAEVICLEYDCPNGHEEFNRGDLDISGDNLAYILSVYRERSGKKYKYNTPITN